MKEKTTAFRVVDALLLCLTILPIVCGMVLKILFTPPAEGIQITGALIYFEVPMPVQNLVITEAQVNAWLVMAAILFLCLYLTHGLQVKAQTKRQIFVEWIVEKSEQLTTGNMGDYFLGFSPFVAAILALSAFSSLLSLFGLYAPTSDINVVAGWAILTFILITYYKFKAGPVQYLKSFGDPVPFLAPLNIISEVATPVSMAFRHYGNILSGSVISVLIAAGLQGLSAMVLGWIPVVGEIPLLQIGLPGVLSIYFDVFSGVLQAYIFAMLTMLYVSGGFPLEKYMAKKAKRQARKQAKAVQ